MARLTDLVDDNVSVIYISPVSNVADVDAYWSKMLNLVGVESTVSRCRILAPENLDSLPANMSLAEKLLISPQAISRIKIIMGDKPAYIVPSIVGTAELELAIALGIPLLAPAPDVAIPLRLRSHRRQAIRTSNVKAPPGIDLRTHFYLKKVREEGGRDGGRERERERGRGRGREGEGERERERERERGRDR